MITFTKSILVVAVVISLFVSIVGAFFAKNKNTNILIIWFKNLKKRISIIVNSQKGPNSITRDPDVYNQMSIARFAGLIQSDGNFDYLIDSEGTVNLRLTLVQSIKKDTWLKAIYDWLDSKDIGVTWSSQKNNTIINLVIDRQNFRKLFKLIQEEEKQSNTLLFFDKKRSKFLLLAKVIEILDKRTEIRKKKYNNNADNARKDQEYQKLNYQLVEIFCFLKPNSSISFKKALKRFKMDENLTINPVDSIVPFCKSCEIQAINEGQTFVTNIDISNLTNQCSDFIAGVVDGDGSFSISLNTNIDKTTNKVKKNRRAFSIQPYFSLTDKKDFEMNTTLFKLFTKVFGKITKKPYQASSKGMRVSIISIQDLYEKVFPFFEKTPLTIKKNMDRLEILKYTIPKIVRTYINKQDDIDLVRYIYKTDYYDARNNTLDEYLSIVDMEYNKPNFKARKYLKLANYLKLK